MKIFAGENNAFYAFYIYLKKDSEVINHFILKEKKDLSNLASLSYINNMCKFSVSFDFIDEKSFSFLVKLPNIQAIYTRNLLNIKFISQNEIVIDNKMNNMDKFEYIKNKLGYDFNIKENKTSFKDFIIRKENSFFLLSSYINRAVFQNQNYEKIKYFLDLYNEIQELIS